MFAHGKHTQFWPITIGTQEKTHETLRSRAIFNPNRFIASPLHGDNPKCTSSLPRALRLRNFGRGQMTLNARANKLRHAVLLHGGLASRCLSTERHGVMLFVCTAKGRLHDVASRGLSMRRFGVAQCLFTVTWRHAASWKRETGKCSTKLQDWKSRDWKKRDWKMRERIGYGKTIKPKQLTHLNSRR